MKKKVRTFLQNLAVSMPLRYGRNNYRTLKRAYQNGGEKNAIAVFHEHQ